MGLRLTRQQVRAPNLEPNLQRGRDLPSRQGAVIYCGYRHARFFRLLSVNCRANCEEMSRCDVFHLVLNSFPAPIVTSSGRRGIHMKMPLFALWMVVLAAAVSALLATGITASAFAVDIRPHKESAEGVWIVPHGMSDRDASSPAQSCDRGEVPEISRPAQWLLVSRLPMP
jgi:hypothetical protein